MKIIYSVYSKNCILNVRRGYLDGDSNACWDTEPQ